MSSLTADTLESLNADAPQWLAQSRARAFDTFQKLEMPSEREEVWRYVELDFDIDEFHLADVDEQPEPSSVVQAVPDPAASVSIVNGSTTARSGSFVGSLEEAPDLIDPSLDVFAAAHASFMHDGVVVSVPDDTVVDRLIVIDVQARTDGVVSFPHVAVNTGTHAEVSVVISYSSSDDRLLVVPQVIVDAGAGSRCRVTTVQQWGTETRAIVHQRARVARDAKVTLSEAGLGGTLSRQHLTVNLEGDGSSSEVLGVYFGERDQTLDYRAFINHIGRSTSSDMLLKGAVEDQATSIFTGLIKIWDDATRTSAFQTNRNLILSDGARAQSVPNLEILCDDVICGHASTSGPLEPQHLYYLMSRGLRKLRAERLLVRGFFDEVVLRMPVPELAEPIRSEVARKFVDAQAEGRV